MTPITHINYPFDISKLLTIANDARSDNQVYHKSMENWKWTHNVKNYYLFELMCNLRVTGWVDFYFQEPNSFLFPHVDPKSLCAINIVLSPEPAPITFYESAVDKDNLGPATHYTYSQAILNTTLFHSVQTRDTERVLFKICIPNESYESVVKKLTGNVA